MLYPLAAGVPLSSGGIATGYSALKLLQALVVSLAAVPVFAFGRRVMPQGYALLAAVLTVASPILLYSGLVMTEVLFYPLTAAALLVVARAVQTARLRDQMLAFAEIFACVLTRAQAVAFVPILAAAVLLEAALARDRSRLRSFWPTWVLLAAVAVAVAVFPRLVGSYAGTLRGGYPLGSALRLSYEHLSFVVLATGLMPATALVLLAARIIRRRETEPAVRALVAVCIAATSVLVLQVGFFASRYAPHLLGRDLAPLPPILFLVFALWLARGGRRGFLAAAAAAFAVLCLVLLAPWNALAVPGAYADSLDLLLLARVRGYAPADVVTVFAVAMLFAFVSMPRRSALVLPAAVLALLVTASIVASNDLARVVRAAQGVLGPDRSWIDHAADSDVAYLYDGEQFWNVVWQERFWNRRIDRVYSATPSLVPGPMPQTPLTAPPNGSLPLHERYVVASDRHTFVGTPVAHLPQQGLDVSGLTLWRLDGTPRLSTITYGVQPNGDIYHPATVSVYDCRRGRLQLTLIPKATNVLRILLDGRLVLQQRIGALKSWEGSVAVPPARHAHRCTFTIVPQPLLGSTHIEFVRDT